MLGKVRRFFHAAKVKENGDIISVNGVPADTIVKDIVKTWGSFKVAQSIFQRLTANSFDFLSFFAPDIHYTLTAIMHAKGTKSNHHAINGLLQELEEQTWLKNLVVDHPSILNYEKLSLMNCKLLPHQMAFLKAYDKRIPAFKLKGYLLSAAAGTGKTIACVGLSLCLEADLVVIVSPKNAVRRVWLDTLETRLNTVPEVWIAEDNLPYKGQKYLIIHYDALAKGIEILRSHTGHKPVVLLDESHNLNESVSQRTNLFVELCNTLRCQHVIWSSGTPLKALGYEMIPILRTIDPLFTTAVEARFRAVFGMASGRAVDILRNRIGLVSFKVTKDQAFSNHPTTHRVEIKLPNGNAYTLDTIRQEMRKFVDERKHYYLSHMDDYEKEYQTALDTYEKTLTTSEQKTDFRKYNEYIRMIRRGYDPQSMKNEAKYCNDFESKKIIPSLPTKEMRDAFRHGRSVIKYVDLKVVGEALGKVLGKKRAECHVDMVPHMALEDIIAKAERKTVIFTSYVDVVKKCDEYLRGKGLHPALVYGDTNSNIAGIIGDFEKNPKTNPLIATYQSLSTAVPLIMANTEIFINQPFRDHERIQARARVDRLGQTAPVFFYDMFLDTGSQPNISTRAGEIVEWSHEMVAAMMGDDPSGKINAQLDGYLNKVSNEMFAPKVDEAFEASWDAYLPH